MTMRCNHVRKCSRHHQRKKHVLAKSFPSICDVIEGSHDWSCLIPHRCFDGHFRGILTSGVTGSLMLSLYRTRRNPHGIWDRALDRRSRFIDSLSFCFAAANSVAIAVITWALANSCAESDLAETRNEVAGFLLDRLPFVGLWGS